jgi:hypothetical protein
MPDHVTVNVYCTGCAKVWPDETGGCGPSIAERLDAIDRSLGTIAGAVEEQTDEARRAHRAEMRRIDEETSALARQLEAILAAPGSIDGPLNAAAAEFQKIADQLDQIGKVSPIPPATT